MGFDAKTCAVLLAIDAQSPDIAMGVDEGTGDFKELGAGDQGPRPAAQWRLVSNRGGKPLGWAAAQARPAGPISCA